MTKFKQDKFGRYVLRIDGFIAVVSIDSITKKWDIGIHKSYDGEILTESNALITKNMISSSFEAQSRAIILLNALKSTPVIPVSIKAKGKQEFKKILNNKVNILGQKVT